MKELVEDSIYLAFGSNFYAFDSILKGLECITQEFQIMNLSHAYLTPPVGKIELVFNENEDEKGNKDLTNALLQAASNYLQALEPLNTSAAAYINICLEVRYKNKSSDVCFNRNYHTIKQKQGLKSFLLAIEQSVGSKKHLTCPLDIDVIPLQSYFATSVEFHHLRGFLDIAPDVHISQCLDLSLAQLWQHPLLRKIDSRFHKVVFAELERFKQVI